MNIRKIILFFIKYLLFSIAFFIIGFFSATIRFEKDMQTLSYLSAINNIKALVFSINMLNNKEVDKVIETNKQFIKIQLTILESMDIQVKDLSDEDKALLFEAKEISKK